jgi:hypothetical protein
VTAELWSAFQIERKSLYSDRRHDWLYGTRCNKHGHCMRLQFCSVICTRNSILIHHLVTAFHRIHEASACTRIMRRFPVLLMEYLCTTIRLPNIDNTRLLAAARHILL